MKRTFIIGFGAQKGGTTWLAANLKAAGVKFPWGKEARILNHIGENTSKNVTHIRLQNALSQTKKQLSNIHSQNQKNMMAALKDSNKSKNFLPLIKKSERKYKSKLNSIWRSASKSYAVMGEENYTQQVELYMNQNELSHAGDITPIYCRLRCNQMSEIYDHLTSSNISPKAIFIARDPVDRIWSSAKMMAKRNPDKFKAPEDTFEFFKNHYRETSVKVRTAYEKTLNNLRNSKFNENLLVLFYEDLFEEKTWDSVLNFLDLETNYNVDFGRVNASPNIPMGLSEEIREEAIKAYADTYIYMGKNYPQVKKLWENSYKLLDK